MRTPDWQSDDGAIQLHCCDCMELLPTIEAGAVDAVVTDPPYGISYCHGARKGGKMMGTDGMSIVGDDKPFDPVPWLVWPCLFWGAEHFKHRLPIGGRWLVWDKRRHGVVRDQADVENAWCSNAGVARMFRQVWDGADRELERDTPRVHSNQKPIALMAWCFGFVAGSTIFDPFMGSGTTAVACIRTGRRFIGCEISREYFDIAIKRIKRELAQPQLFAAPVETHTQAEMFGASP